MFKILLALIALIALSVGAYWFSENTGELSFAIMGYQIETTVLVGVISLFFLIIVLLFISSIIRKIINIPQSIKGYFEGRKHQKVLDSMANIIICNLFEDKESLAKYASKLRDSTDDAMLKEISEVMAYKSDDMEKLATLKASMKTKEGKVLANSLIVKKYIEAKDWSQAYVFLTDSWSQRKNRKTFNDIVELTEKSGRWSDFANFLVKNSSFTDRARLNQLNGLVAYHTGKDMISEGKLDDGLSKLLQALKLMPDHHESFILFVGTCHRNKIKAKLLNTISSYYPKMQRADVTGVILALSDFMPQDQLYSLGMSLHKTCNESLESTILMVQLSLNAGMYDQAFSAVSKALSEHGKTSRLCLLMAELCQRTQGTTKETIEWIKDALAEYKSCE